MRKNIWLIMFGTMMLTTAFAAFLQGCQEQNDVPPTQITIVTAINTVPSTLTKTIIATRLPFNATSTIKPTPSSSPPLTVISTIKPSEIPSPLTIATASTEPTKTLLSTATSPIETPTPALDEIGQQLQLMDEMVLEIRRIAEQIPKQVLEDDQCPYIMEGFGTCQIAKAVVGNRIYVEAFVSRPDRVFPVDLYAYDFDGDEQFDVLRWDLDRDGIVDVIEYDMDGDGDYDYATADLDDNGQADIYQNRGNRWRPLIVGAFGLPLLPIFPY